MSVVLTLSPGLTSRLAGLAGFVTELINQTLSITNTFLTFNN